MDSRNQTGVLEIKDEIQIDVKHSASQTAADELSGRTSESPCLYHVYWKSSKKHLILTTAPEPSPSPCHTWKDYLKASPKYDPEVPHGSGYFVRQPYLSFHHPPRTLRRGTSRNSPAICLVENSWFWKRWTLRFSERLVENEVVDPRGVVHRRDTDVLDGKEEIKSYRVRTWRLWGESGKAYHRHVNEEGGKARAQKQASSNKVSEKVPTSAATRPAISGIATEDIHLDWRSPLSRGTRRYHFHYKGLEFYWKGTGTVSHSGICGRFVRFNHLKLIARVALNADGDVSEADGLQYFDVCLAKYTSSASHKKAGVLEMYDEAVERLHLLHRSLMPMPDDDNEKEEEGRSGIIRKLNVRNTHLYDIIVATAACMIIGESQKREWLKGIVETLLAGADGGAGGS